MKIFNARITVLGINSKLEHRRQSLVAESMEDALDITRRILIDSIQVVTDVVIEQSNEQPFPLDQGVKLLPQKEGL
ncbi:MAG TPA: hypothetical protein VF077_13105 [Nitrospiraceae bacterium]